ncbi:MAG: hypothetical protein AYK19_05635 [Theionarchaea archaeon DG-70-1]|nr:MAG: hypothetical protein AYK19_05635 [Theionarchaea archaeon DG-70-1]
MNSYGAFQTEAYFPGALRDSQFPDIVHNLYVGPCCIQGSFISAVRGCHISNNGISLDHKVSL